MRGSCTISAWEPESWPCKVGSRPRSAASHASRLAAPARSPRTTPAPTAPPSPLTPSTCPTLPASGPTAFLQFPNLRRVVGVELAFSRFSLGEEALLTLAHKFPHDFVVAEWAQGESIRLATTLDKRELEFRRGNMLDVTPRELARADIVVVETDVLGDLYAAMSAMLCQVRRGARLLTYLNLAKVWLGPIFPVEQLPVNRSPEDRFLTSWSAKRGHHFFVWLKITDPFDWNAAVATATARSRSQPRTRGVRRLYALFQMLRLGVGHRARERRQEQEQARRQQELERLTLLATSRALAVQRAAKRVAESRPDQQQSGAAVSHPGQQVHAVHPCSRTKAARPRHRLDPHVQPASQRILDAADSPPMQHFPARLQQHGVVSRHRGSPPLSQTHDLRSGQPCQQDACPPQPAAARRARCTHTSAPYGLNQASLARSLAPATASDQLAPPPPISHHLSSIDTHPPAIDQLMRVPPQPVVLHSGVEPCVVQTLPQQDSCGTSTSGNITGCQEFATFSASEAPPPSPHQVHSRNRHATADFRRAPATTPGTYDLRPESPGTTLPDQPARATVCNNHRLPCAGDPTASDDAWRPASAGSMLAGAGQRAVNMR